MRSAPRASCDSRLAILLCTGAASAHASHGADADADVGGRGIRDKSIGEVRVALGIRVGTFASAKQGDL